MAAGVRPTFKRDFKFLKELWDKILKEGPGVLTAQPLDLCWPPPDPICAQTGRHSRFLFLSFLPLNSVVDPFLFVLAPGSFSTFFRVSFSLVFL